MTHTRDTLLAFSARVRAAFLAKQIRSPVHMPDGTEEIAIRAFANIKPTDWVLSNWRSMYHALLHGIPEEELFSMILDGRSMFIMSAERRFMASSIVGGMLPIAAGLALGIRLRGDKETVNVFLGDMSATIGLYHEFMRYCQGQALPVRVYIDDNGLSTDSPTLTTWGTASKAIPVRRQYYKRPGPHVGVGEKVVF